MANERSQRKSKDSSMSYLVSIDKFIPCNQIIGFGGLWVFSVLVFFVGIFCLFFLVLCFGKGATGNCQEASCPLLRMHQKLVHSGLVRARFKLWYLLQMALSHSFKSSIDPLGPSNQLTIYDSIYNIIHYLL